MDPEKTDILQKDHVLLVEDSNAERFRLTLLLGKLGFEVSQASNGLEALDILSSGSSVSIILSDWSMPVMSGLDLCRRIRQEGFNDPYFILVTGRDTMSDLVEGMEAGADDFIAKPFNSEELRVRIGAGQRIMKLRHKLQDRNRQLEVMMQREADAAAQTRKDLAMASEMLSELLPRNGSLGPGLFFQGVFRPATEVGGDFYNFFQLDADHVGFYLLDVAGHGIPSALMSFTLARSISPTPRSESILFDDQGIRAPSEVVSVLNERFCSQSSSMKYFTMVYGVINTCTGDGQFCQAGHPYPLIVDGVGNIASVGGGGFPVGILPGAEFSNVDFDLPAGSRMVVYSDGVTECENAEENLLGEDRFHDLLSQTVKLPVNSAVSQVDNEIMNWKGDFHQNDDMTFFFIERQ